MDWGTPRLVTKNRALVMDPTKMRQKELLNNIASIRSGAPTIKQEEQKSDFKAVTVTNFREKMLQEEKQMVKPNDTVVIEQGNVPPTAATTYPPTTSIRPLGANPDGGVLAKLRNQNEDEIVNKLKA